MNRNKLIFFTILAAGLILFVFLIFGYFESKRNINRIQESHAKTIINTMNTEFKHTLESTSDLEGLIINQLNTSSYLIDIADLSNNPNIQRIKKLAVENQITSVSYLDKKGNLLASTNEKLIITVPSKELLSDLNKLAESDEKILDLGIIVSPFTGKKVYNLLRKRTNGNGFILIGIGNDKLIELRRNFGIGAKIEELISNPEIAYVVLQDEFGIYAASSNLTEVSSLQNDEELMTTVIKKEIIMRNVQFQNKHIIEVSKAFQLGEGNLIVTRIGLNQDEIDEIRADAIQRNIFAVILTFLVLVIALIYILTREKLVNLGIEHQKIQQYVQVLLENIADGVIALDANRKIIVFNEAAQSALEMPKAETIGRNYSEIFENDIFNIQSALQGEPASKDNYIQFHTNKSNTHHLAFTTNATYYFDELESYIILIRDITNQVKLQKQMEMKEKQSAINQLASGIAHEIRNPLNAIFLIIQRFQLDFTSVSKNEEFQDLLKTIRGEIIRINEIIEEFLEYSRPQKLNLQRTNLSELLDEIITLSENLAIRKRVELHKNYKEYISLNLDSGKIKQVILNLVQNSFDAMPNGGDIIISAVQEENHTKIRVTDSGTGIPDEVKNKIFTLYFTTKKTGHGIGLAIVNQIISEHEGKITVQSNVGGGTTFEITLPNN